MIDPIKYDMSSTFCTITEMSDKRENREKQFLRPELISIINGLELMGVVIPDTISKNLNERDFCEQPEYYFIALNNNPEVKGGSTPKMKMAGYLFGGKTWGSRKTSSKVGTDASHRRLPRARIYGKWHLQGHR